MSLPLRPRNLDRWAQFTDAPTRHRVSRRQPLLREPRCLAPLHYEPDYRYPLVIWADDSETPWTLVKALGAISLRNHAGVAPADRATSPSVLNRFSPRPLETCRIEQARELAGRRMNIHPDRVFVVGRGSSLARLVNEIPDRIMRELAGIAWIAEGSSTCDAADIDWTRRVDLPLLLCLPESVLIDQPDEVAIQMRRMHAAGFDLTLITSSDRPTFTSNALANVNRWIMGFVTGTPPFAETQIETMDWN